MAMIGYRCFGKETHAEFMCKQVLFGYYCFMSSRTSSIDSNSSTFRSNSRNSNSIRRSSKNNITILLNKCTKFFL